MWKQNIVKHFVQSYLFEKEIKNPFGIQFLDQWKVLDSNCSQIRKPLPQIVIRLAQVKMAKSEWPVWMSLTLLF